MTNPVPPSSAPATLQPLLSVVVPVYFNEASVAQTAERLIAVGRRIAGENFQIIFVDDGSRDRSFPILREVQERYPSKLTIIKLTRNFGSMAAIQSGLAAARGEFVGIISADLQDPPELFVDMFAKLQEGAKCAFAVRQERAERGAESVFAKIYYQLLRRYALPGYPEGGFDFCLVHRQVVNEILRMNEKNAHVMNLIYWTGFPSVWLPYKRRERVGGRSRWTLGKKLKLFADSFVAFSFTPIRAVSLAGFGLALLALLYGLFEMYLRLRHGSEVQGFTTIVTLIAFTSGIQMMMLGILGEYLWRTLDASRARPPYVVERIFDTPDA